MSDFFSTRSGIGVHQRRKFFELRNQYELSDESGQPAGTVEQARQSAIAWLARLGTSFDTMLPTTLHVAAADGTEVLTLHKPWFRWEVSVTDAAGRTIGRIKRVLRIGKPVYSLTSTGGAQVGEIRGEDWRSRNFQVLDGTGVEIGRVTKNWRGLLTEAFTDADSYAVTFSQSANADQRALTFAGALTVDLIQKQKDTGGGIGNILNS